MADSGTLRPPRPDDLHGFRIATDPRLSPGGDRVVFTVQSVAPSKDGYREALWSVATDGSAPPRQLTIGHKHDTHADDEQAQFADLVIGENGACRRAGLGRVVGVGHRQWFQAIELGRSAVAREIGKCHPLTPRLGPFIGT